MTRVVRIGKMGMENGPEIVGDRFKVVWKRRVGKLIAKMSAKMQDRL